MAWQMSSNVERAFWLGMGGLLLSDFSAGDRGTEGVRLPEGVRCQPVQLGPRWRNGKQHTDSYTLA